MVSRRIIEAKSGTEIGEILLAFENTVPDKFFVLFIAARKRQADFILLKYTHLNLRQGPLDD
jgi:hypothetical protein